MNMYKTDKADDETDMKALEEHVRSVELDGLVWGGSKLVAVGYGIKKMQVNFVVEDDKVSIDSLQEQLESFEDYVQSTDVVSTLYVVVVSADMSGRHDEVVDVSV